MADRTIMVDGSPVPHGETITVDHQVQTFTITLRSMVNADPVILKRLIQQRYEVLSVESTNKTFYARQLGAVCPSPENEGQKAQRIIEIQDRLEWMNDNLSGCDWCCGGGDQERSDLIEELNSLQGN